MSDTPPHLDTPPSRPHRGLLASILSKSWLIQILVAVGMLALAAWQVNPRDAAQAFVDVRYDWLLAALLIYVTSRLLHVWEWQIVLTKVGRAPFFGAFGVLLIGSLVNAIFPANLGDVAKVQIMANRYGLARGGLIAGRGAEMVVNGLMFVIFVLVSLVLARDQGAPKGIIYLIAAASTVASVAAIAASLMMPATLPRGRLLTKLPKRAYTALEHQWPRLHDGFESIRRPRLLVTLLLLNLAGWAFDIAIYYAFGRAFNLDVPVGAYVSVTVVLSVITTFPITFGNVGSFEFGILGALAIYGAPSDQALAFALGVHIFSTLFNIALGLVAMLLMGVKPSDVLWLRTEKPAVAETTPIAPSP